VTFFQPTLSQNNDAKQENRKQLHISPHPPLISYFYSVTVKLCITEMQNVQLHLVLIVVTWLLRLQLWTELDGWTDKEIMVSV